MTNYKPVLYIAGPMRGYPDYNHPAFFEVERKAKEIGWRVINPAVLPTDYPQYSYMPICIAMIQSCDAIYVLPYSEDSIGACAEVAFAKAQGLPQLKNYDELKQEYMKY